jgi:hypothetical protein
MVERVTKTLVKREIAQLGNVECQWDIEAMEWQIWPRDQPDAIYYTSDNNDAIAEAKEISARLKANQG